MISRLRRNQKGFTLVEIMIVVAIIGLLAAIDVPSFMRARMRAQASTVLNEYRQLDAAKDQYALENNKTGTSIMVWADTTPYLKAGSKLADSGAKDALGNWITVAGGGAITMSSRLSVNTATKTALSTAVDDTFWGPFS